MFSTTIEHIQLWSKHFDYGQKTKYDFEHDEKLDFFIFDLKAKLKRDDKDHPREIILEKYYSKIKEIKDTEKPRVPHWKGTLLLKTL